MDTDYQPNDALTMLNISKPSNITLLDKYVAPTTTSKTISKPKNNTSPGISSDAQTPSEKKLAHELSLVLRLMLQLLLITKFHKSHVSTKRIRNEEPRCYRQRRPIFCKQGPLITKT